VFPIQWPFSNRKGGRAGENRLPQKFHVGTSWKLHLIDSSRRLKVLKLLNFPKTAMLLVYAEVISGNDSQIAHRLTEKTEKRREGEKLGGIRKLGKWEVGR
jgi:hypothetical protein